MNPGMVYVQLRLAERDPELVWTQARSRPGRLTPSGNMVAIGEHACSVGARRGPSAAL